MPALTWNGEAGTGCRWPLSLSPGSVLGLFAPAHFFNRSEMERGVAVLKSWGLKVRIPKGIFRRLGYLAGDDQARLEIFTELMSDPTVDGLMAVRGGYGCQRLLPFLAERWPNWPAKPIFGFSDLTALHLARLAAGGVIGFHAPMLVSLGKNDPGPKADQLSRSDLKKTLISGQLAGGWTFSERQVLRPGRAVGPLLGGNLTLVTALTASPWLPEFEGAILMLEEVGEVPYRLDRLLITLRQSLIWKQAAGVVFGSFSACGRNAEVNRLLREAADDFPGRPVLRGAPFGHLSRNRLFPLGAQAILEA